jgi:hypothetical protein
LGIVAAADADSAVRLRAFAFLEEQTRLHGDGLPWSVPSRGFDYEGRRVPLVGPQGIFTPAVLRLPLTITTAPVVVGKERPYDDHLGADGLLEYRYRGTDARHRDNTGLREVMQRKIPLVYLHGVMKGWYVAAVTECPQLAFATFRRQPSLRSLDGGDHLALKATRGARQGPSSRDQVELVADASEFRNPLSRRSGAGWDRHCREFEPLAPVPVVARDGERRNP